MCFLISNMYLDLEIGASRSGLPSPLSPLGIWSGAKTWAQNQMVLGLNPGSTIQIV